MKRVGVAALKSRLSEHLRYVRRGREITVMDRDTPVARLVPYVEAEDDTIIEPPPGAPLMSEVLRPVCKLSSADVDIVAFLREDRDRR